MNDLKTLQGFLNALDDQIESAFLCMNDPPAFLAATQAIEKLLSEDWSTIRADLQVSSVLADDHKRLMRLLESISLLETKTRARLAWSEDFEAHMRRAMETIS